MKWEYLPDARPLYSSNIILDQFMNAKCKTMSINDGRSFHHYIASRRQLLLFLNPSNDEMNHTIIPFSDIIPQVACDLSAEAGYEHNGTRAEIMERYDTLLQQMEKMADERCPVVKGCHPEWTFLAECHTYRRSYDQANSRSSIVIHDGETFNIEDDVELHILLNLAADIATGDANMDTGCMFMDYLDRVLTRLKAN